MMRVGMEIMGQIVGQTLTADRFGILSKAYSFSSNYIEVPTGVLNNMPQGTVSAFIKLNQINVQHTIIDKTVTGTINYFQFIVENDNKLRTIINENGSLSFKSNTILNVNTWYLVTVTWDGVYLNYYLNGNPDGNITCTSSIPSVSRSTFIGKVENNTAYFNGTLDDLRIYNRALSASEIDALYHEGGYGLVPTITSFTPTSGSIGTTVTITGSNFDAIAANNAVYFGAVKATVTAATSNSLTVKAPLGATHQPITVTNLTNGLLGHSSLPFQVKFPTQSSTVDANTFSPYQLLSFGASIYNVSMALGDLDLDGKTDMVVANQLDNKVVIFRNKSVSGNLTSASFDTKVELIPGLKILDVALGDIDGDGKKDIVAVCTDDNKISIYRNISTSGSITTSSFAARVDLTTGTYPYNVAIDDFDGDGKNDIAVVNNNSNSFSIFRNNSTLGNITSSTFDARVDITTTSGPFYIATGDIDNDGKVDIAIGPSSSTINIFRNTSTSGVINSSSFSTRVDLTALGNSVNIALGDVDADGKIDLVTSNYYNQKVSVFKNSSSTGSISFATNVDFVVGTNPNSVAIADINGDGNPDIVATNGGSNSVSVLKSTGSASVIDISSFDTKVDYPVYYSATCVDIGDLDCDGKPDLVVVHGSNPSLALLKNNLSDPLLIPTISSITPTSGPIGTTVTITGTNFSANPANSIVWFGAVKATVTAATETSLTVTVPAGATYQPVSVTEINGGLSAYSTKPFLVTFASSQTIDATSFSTKVDYAAGSYPWVTALGDLDGDGKSDVVVTNNGSNDLSIFRNTSTSGSLTASSLTSGGTLTGGTSPWGVVLGDVDGDGKQDIIATNYNGNNLSIYRNISSSGTLAATSFSTAVNLNTGAQPNYVALSDMDFDGKPDMVVTNFHGNSVSIYKNTSSLGTISASSFATNFDLSAGSYTTGLAISDIDGDGKPDIVVTNETSNTVSIFRNNSIPGTLVAGSFDTRVDLSANTYPTGLAVGDIDGDSKPDIVTTNYGSGTNSISIFRNIGTSGSISTSSFYTRLDISCGTGPNYVSLADVDGDGKLDLVITNFGSGANSVSVFKNKASSGSITLSSFDTRVDYTTGSGPNGISVGDIDGDGRPDFIMANNTGNSITVLKNTIPLVSVPSISSFSTSSGIAGSSVTIYGSNFGATQGSSTVKFGSTTATVTSWSDLQLVVTVPSVSNGSYTIYVTTSTGTASSSSQFTVASSPTITSFTPSTGVVGASVTITGTSFGASQGSSTIKFGSSAATVTSWSDAQIIATVPSLSAGSYTISVTTSAGTVNSSTQYTVVVAPVISSFNPLSGGVGSFVTINGTAFGASQGTSTVKFGTTIAAVTSWSDTQITVNVPGLAAGSYTIYITTIGGTGSSSTQYTVQMLPTITSFTPTYGPIGTSVTITGTNFNTAAANNVVWFGAVNATVSAATATQLTVTVPLGATYKPISVTNIANGLTSYSSKPFGITFLSSENIVSSSFDNKQTFNVSSGSGPWNTAIGDLDGNGKSDVVVTNSMNSTVSVFTNSSVTGTISLPVRFDLNTGSAPSGVCIGDIDGDGKLDIVVSCFGTGAIAIFRNVYVSGGTLSAGSFAPKVDYQTGANPRGIALNDIDGDGKTDVVVTNFTDNTISILRNTSTSGTIAQNSLAPKIDLSVGTNPFDVAIGDIDGDRKPDIIVANEGSTSLSLFRNISSVGSILSSSFEAKVNLEVGVASSGVEIVDVDSDGKDDLAILNKANSAISILKNNSVSGAISSNSFATKVDFNSNAYQNCISSCDLNGDNKPELVVTTNTAVSIFMNTSKNGLINSSTFASKVDITSGTQPFGLDIGDLDNDGKPDLIYTTFNGNNITVNRNIITLPALPSITSFTPTSAITGTSVTITGNNFGISQGTNLVKFGTTVATVISWSMTQIVVTVPTLTAGNYTISVTTTGGTGNSSSQFVVPSCNKPTIRKKGSINILICQTADAPSYQWYLNNSAIANATKQFHVARSNYGSYTVQVLESNGCNTRSDATIINTSSLVSIYPNPTDKEFNAILDFEQTGKVTIRLTNSTGSVKKVISINKEFDSQTLPIDVSDLEKGVYFIDIEIDGDRFDSQKIVIL